MPGRLKPKSEIYSQGSELQTEWGMDSVLKEYDGLLSKAYAECAAWRIVGIVAIAVICFCVVIIGFNSTKPKTDLVVIGVNDIGETKYYGVVKGKNFDTYGYKDDVLKHNIELFVKNRYQISTDNDLMYENFRTCLFYLDANRRKSFINTINEEDPFSSVGKYKRNAIVDTKIKLSDNSWQVEWYVNTSEMTGNRNYTEHYRGIFSFKSVSSDQYMKLTEEEKNYNPSGYYITDYQIEKIKVEEF